MAGFKQVMTNLNPVAFYTLDGEQLKEDKLTLERNDIIDEMGNSNGNIVTEVNDPMIPCYAISESLVPLDRSGQRGIRFCPRGPQQYAVDQGKSRFPKAYIIAPNCHEWDFSAKEFTYVFMIRRNNSYNFDDAGVYWGRKSYDDCFFEHNGIISMGQSYSYIGISNWWIKIPGFGGTRETITGNLTKYNSMTSNSTFIVVRCKNRFLEVYRNCELIYSKDYSSTVDYLSYSFETGTKQFTLGGSDAPQTSTQYSDRICAQTEFDQFAIFNRAITNLEMSRLYRRIRGYNEMIKDDSPEYYFPCDELQLATDNRLENYGTSSALYPTVYGDRGMVLSRINGPMPNSYGMYFGKGTSLKTGNNGGNNGNMIQLGSNFTFMLNFKIAHGDQGVIFAQQSENPDYKGLTIWANSRNKQRYAGNIEITLSNNIEPIQVSSNMDAKWHSIYIVRNGNYMNIWFDGVKVVNDYYYVASTPTNAGGTSLLSSHLNISPIEASLSGLIIYNRALPEAKLRAFNDWESIYILRGTVTLNGNPTNALIRAYDFNTGGLIAETHSNPETGVYMMHLFDNSPLIVTVLDKEDTNVKIKAYGPIIPYEVDDQPYYL